MAKAHKDEREQVGRLMLQTKNGLPEDRAK